MPHYGPRDPKTAEKWETFWVAPAVEKAKDHFAELIESQLARVERMKKGEFRAARPHAALSTGEVIRMLRELKGWTQAELSRRSKISVPNISLLENERVEIGKRRAESLARAFDVHPAIIMFPEYEAREIERAA